MSEIKFEGLDEILESLDSLVSEETVNKALTKACLLVERAAKQKAPKVNGELRNSIQHKVENLQGIVFTNLEYAPYVEYGTGLFSIHPMGGRKDVPWVYKDLKTGEFIATSGMHPQPYMRPAIDENREEILRILREGIHGKND